MLASTACELAARQVARRSLLPAALGGSWTSTTLAIAAACSAAVIYLAAARRNRGLSGGAPPLFAFLFVAGLALQLALGARLQSDGFYYYAYLRSLAFDGDVNFLNDYRLLGLTDKPHLFQRTATNHAHSAWTIGPAILWAPFFAAGHVVARQLNQANPDVSVNGISFPYRQSVCVAGLFYGLLGCWFMYRLTRRFRDGPVAAAATALTVGGSFMLWYLVKEPSMTHAPSMAVVAGFTWAWASTLEKRTRAQWVLLGLLAGFMTLVRWQNALFALLPACEAASALFRAWRRNDRPAALSTLAGGVLFTAAAMAAFVPQMLAWRAIYGSLLAVSPVGPELRFRDAHIIDILWSARNGLFTMSPVLYVGAAGLLLFARAVPAAGVPALLTLAAMIFFNASIQDWWGSDGYGGRRFDGTLPLFCIGVAFSADATVRVVQRFPGAAVAAAGAALILWNVTLMSVANANIFRIGTTVSFGDTMAHQARAFHGWFGNPFTYPVSLVYALRNGVSPGRYDLLSANRFLGDPRQPYGRIDIGFEDEWLLGPGWHQREQEGPVTFRWAAPSAALLVPLDHAATLRVQVRLHSFAYPGAPPQSVTLAVNGREHGPAAVEPGWHVIELDVPEGSWRSGANPVELRFGWGRTPAEVGLGNDPRQLAAAVDYVRVAVKAD